MTVEILGAIAAGILSLAVAYVPGLKDRFDQLDAAGKARWMAALLVVVTFGAFGLACANLLVLFGLEVACSAEGGVALLRILIAALVVNQAVFQIGVRPFKS